MELLLAEFPLNNINTILFTTEIYTVIMTGTYTKSQIQNLKLEIKLKCNAYSQVSIYLNLGSKSLILPIFRDYDQVCMKGVLKVSAYAGLSLSL